MNTRNRSSFRRVLGGLLAGVALIALSGCYPYYYGYGHHHGHGGYYSRDYGHHDGGRHHRWDRDGRDRHGHYRHY